MNQQTGSLRGCFIWRYPRPCITEGKAIYLLPIFLGALLVWITLKVGKESAPAAVGLYWVWGLIAGLAFWTTFLSMVFLVLLILLLWAMAALRVKLPSANNSSFPLEGLRAQDNG